MWKTVWDQQPQWKLPEYTWGEEQQTCKACKHYRERLSGRAYYPTILMKCALNITRCGSKGDKFGSCIDMRHEGPCGRDAKLFESN